MPPTPERVAEVYTAAFAEGRYPTKAVAAEFDVAYPTAARYVSAARRAGALPPASPGRPAAAESIAWGGKLGVRFTAPRPGTYHLGLGAPPHLVGECPPECQGDN